LFLHSNPNLL